MILSNVIEKKPITSHHRIFISIMCLFAAIFYCYEYMLRVMPSVMRPELMYGLSISDAKLGALVAFYYVGYVPLQIPVGILMDRYGARVILSIACGICAVGAYLFIATYNLSLVKLGRFLTGCGSAFAYIGMLKIANMWLPRKYFALIAGATTSLGMVGAIAGEIVVVSVIEVIDWQYSYNLAAIFGLLLTAILWVTLRDNHEPGEQRASYLLSELWLVIRNKQLWIIGVIGCLTYMSLSVFAEMWAVGFFEQSGFAKRQAANLSSMVFFGYGVGAPIWGFISDRLRSRKKPIVFGSFMALITISSVLYITINEIWLTYILLFLFGFSASVEILVFAVGNDISDKSLVATTIAFINFLVMLGGIFLQPLVGIILDYTANFKLALSILPLGMFSAALLGIVSKESY